MRNGPGCKTCPVRNCDTFQYRGSRCAALRDQHGLDDPNAEKIPKESHENEKILTIPLEDWEKFYKELRSNLEPDDTYDTGYGDALDRVDDWFDTHARAERNGPASGHWEFVNDYEARCTNCGENSWIDHNAEHRFCPNCGTKMASK